MCDTANATILETIVDELLAKDEMFTAWDVTSEARKRGATERHWQMREEVHRIMFGKTNDPVQPISYTVTWVKTPGPDARLWHPVGADIQPAIDRINGNSAAPAPIPAATNPVAGFGIPATPAVSVAVDDSVFTDVEGRLPIYHNTLSMIGMVPGDTVMVCQSLPNGDELIVLPEDDGLARLELYKVNADGRMRVGNKLVRQVFGDYSGPFKITADTNANRVRISKH